jgi:BMFP domain-containing protein YqiC
MSSPASRIFDDLGRLMTDAAGVASGMKREVDSMVKSQIERLLRDADVVTREEFEAVRDMAVLAREENEALKTRIAALEAAATPAQKKAKS